MAAWVVADRLHVVCARLPRAPGRCSAFVAEEAASVASLGGKAVVAPQVALVELAVALAALGALLALPEPCWAQLVDALAPPSGLELEGPEEWLARA